MKDSFFIAKLMAPNVIKILLLSSVSKDERNDFSLVIDGITVETLKIEKATNSTSGWMYEVKPNSEIVLGHQYDIVVEHFGTVPLDVSSYTEFPYFDKEYSYFGTDLGMTYSRESTSFAVWAPLASRVVLKYAKPNEIWDYLPMERTAQGVYRAKLIGDQELLRYRYLVVNSGSEKETTDPYAKASTQNGEDSVVVDLAKTVTDFHQEVLPRLEKYTDAIIYETSVRDMTSDMTTTVVNKARFLGMAETGTKTAKGLSAGFDYIKSLGITHIQLMPVYDFKTVDEKDPPRFYNWGYDPAQYFVPEGSYASVLEDPYSRIRDLKTLVAAYHQSGIRVNLDVVYNHVYLYQFSVFEKVVPNYYFRRKKNGKMSDGSFCGNDLATERPMVRKLVIEACVYWVKEFGIDGYRFDLMGIIDADTMRSIVKLTREIKPDFMIYGEGWNMPTELPDELRTSMNHSDHFLDVAFFNDAFRDIVKGGTMGDKIAEPGYILGASNYRLGFKFSYAGSCLDLIFPAKFRHAGQTINYVECHDNETFFDKLEAAHEVDDLEIRLKRVKLANAAVMLSFGIPFFHMGQEIGLSKKGDSNSYRSGDKVNKFDYRVLDDRREMALYFSSLAQLRKQCAFMHLEKASDIENMIRFEDLDDGGLLIDYVNKNKIAPYKDFIVIFNPSKDTLYYDLEDYYQIIFTDSGLVDDKEIYARNLMVNAVSLVVCVRK